MKMTDEQRMQYYAEQGIDRRDLLSTDDLRLDDLPPDAQLDGPSRSLIEGVVAEWNRLDPLAKIDAAGTMERRVLGRRTAVPAEAWCAFLLLGRVRGTEARRAAMQRIARGELTPADVRQIQSKHKPRAPLSDAARRDMAAYVAPIHARLRDAGFAGVRRETTVETTETGDIVTVHHIRAVRPGARRSKR
jgi:hypothetical protein